ncbi:MAG: hypothetical protein WD963_01620 [Candidatus Paceibacterota bacterium]
MTKDEKLKNTEIFFKDIDGQNSPSQLLSTDYVDKMFILEIEMLTEIQDQIRPETKGRILEKINRQKDVLLEIADNELQAQEQINNRKNSAIDDNFFQKKPLNINNI